MYCVLHTANFWQHKTEDAPLEKKWRIKHTHSASQIFPCISFQRTEILYVYCYVYAFLYVKKIKILIGKPEYKYNFGNLVVNKSIILKLILVNTV
jgi:hypothetical protein